MYKMPLGIFILVCFIDVIKNFVDLNLVCTVTGIPKHRGPVRFLVDLGHISVEKSIY